MPETSTAPATEARLRRDRRLYAAAWSLLLLPFLLLLVAAGGNERASWPDLLPGEATVLMQAGSLLEDHDLLYTRLDFDRLLLAWRGNPPDLVLATGGDGRRIGFHYPAAYAVYLAPFLALAPERGIAFGNLALLLAAAVFAARTLSRRLGLWAPPLLAVWLFASVAFTGVFRADGDLFALALVLAAAACWLRAEEAPRSGSALAAGALLSPVFLAQPLALLLLPLFAWWPAAEIRRRLAPPLLLGAGLGALLLVLVQWWNGGGLYFAATSSFEFTPATGYPAVDFAPADWASEVKTLAALHWDGAPRLAWGFEPRLMAWNALYFLAGGQLGVLPYLLPLALLLVLPGALAGRRPLLAAAGASMLLLLLLQPFNFWNGPGPLGNRALMPLYGAAILALPALRQRLDRLRGWALPAVAAPLLLAAPFLFLLWRTPGAWPYEKAAYVHRTAAARALLPHEASQRWLPGGAIEELNGVWVAALDQQSWVERRSGSLGIAGERAAFLLCSGRPLSSVLLELDQGGPSEIEVRGGRLGDRLLRADGGIGFRVEPRLWRRHALWFSPLPMYIYRLELELPPGRQGDTLFRLSPAWPAGEDR